MRDKLRAVFAHVDTNKDGLISRLEFLELLDDLELDMDDDEANSRFAKVRRRISDAPFERRGRERDYSLIVR